MKLKVNKNEYTHTQYMENGWNLNDWVVMCTLFFQQYITTWIYAMPYWSPKFAFVRNQ